MVDLYVVETLYITSLQNFGKNEAKKSIRDKRLGIKQLNHSQNHREPE